MKKNLAIILSVVLLIACANAVSADELVKTPTFSDIAGKWEGRYTTNSSKSSRGDVSATIILNGNSVVMNTSSTAGNHTYENVLIKGSEIIATNPEREVSLQLYRSGAVKTLKGDYLNRGVTMGRSTGGTYELTMVK